MLPIPQFPGLMPQRERPIYDIIDNPHAIPPSIIIPLILVVLAPWTLFWVLYIRRTTVRESRVKSAIIMVLGDIGRSPRMMYHAESLAKRGWDTFLVGYGETPPIPPLVDNPKVHLMHLAEPPRWTGSLPWIARAPIRVAYQIYSVIHLCIWAVPCNTELFMVQNPPSIPTLILAQLISMSTGSRLIIDWHNTGHSILAMRLGRNNPLTKIAKWIEANFGSSAAAHIFVTRALGEALSRDWQLEGRKIILHDRPPAHFRRTPVALQHELLHRLLPTLSPPLSAALAPASNDDSTPCTRLSSSGQAEHFPDRPALLVSSTSWTADEDFSLLITALDAYQSAIDSGDKSLPKLIVLITGKGGLRAAFEKTVSKREKGPWKDVTVRCVFVSAEDYPILLGSADLGVSLHSSSSGKDLPMKVVDMFGCGVPVLARKFACIHELVKAGENGQVFSDGQELGQQLQDVLASFPSSDKLSELRSYFDDDKRTTEDGAIPVDRLTWDQNWERVVVRGFLERGQ
ncbi:hypothetical protein IAU60_004399 [Kwoniella sp. DSM 27419]